MKNPFQGLSGFNRVDLALLMLTSAALALSWRLALYAFYGLLICTVVSVLTHRPLQYVSLTKLQKWMLGAMMVYMLLYVVSLIYTDDMADGMEVVTKKLPFLLMPLVFMLSDHSYITGRHIRSLLWVFTLTLTVRFVVRLIIALSAVAFGGATLAVFSSSHFDPMHHSYLCMYTIFALVFIWREYLRCLPVMSTKAKVGLIVWAMMMVLYTIFIQSRSGVLMLIMVGVMMIVESMVRTRDYRRGVIAALVLLGVVIAVAFLLPDQFNRLNQTVTELVQGDSHDPRLTISRTALMAIGDNMPFGTGAGDKIAAMNATFAVTDPSLISHNFNPHNQYLDSLLSIGILGLLSLVTFLVLPLFYRTRTEVEREQKWYWSLLTGIIAFSALFESIFERQMGILLYCFFICLLFTTASSVRCNADELGRHTDC